MNDKEKYYNIIEKNVIKSIYEDSLSNNSNYFDYFMKVALNIKDVEPHYVYLKRCIIGNDYQSLVYFINANKLVVLNDKIVAIVNHQVKEFITEKLALDIVRILINNKQVHYALKIMTSNVYYKVHSLKDLDFLGDDLKQVYLFGQNYLPPYFVNQFNELETQDDKEKVVKDLIMLYVTILNESKKYYCGILKDNHLVLEYPNNINKHDKRFEFNFVDEEKLNCDEYYINQLKRIKKDIEKTIRR
ncbi:MAG: hypothetical protein SO253_02740 [Bacilli bacterium]|nr:hypothetical protein [Bacilli bacterium]